MFRVSCVLVALWGLVGAVGGDETAAQKELKALAGKWKASSGERDGQPFPKDQLPPLAFELRADGTATATMPPKGEKVELTYAVNPATTPKAITNTHESGSAKGAKQYGIYKLEGHKLTVCSSTIPALETDRPKQFSTKGTKHVLFVFEREDDKR